MALGAIIACGLLYALIGALVQAIGTAGLSAACPVVTGSVVAVIGLNLAAIPIKNMAASNFDSWMRAVTFVSVGLVAVCSRGMVQRLLILVGAGVPPASSMLLTNGMGLEQTDGFSASPMRPGSACPVYTPVFERGAMLLIAPVALILVAENLGHIKAVTRHDRAQPGPYMGRAFIGDGIATMVSGSAGSTA